MRRRDFRWGWPCRRACATTRRPTPGLSYTSGSQPRAPRKHRRSVSPDIAGVALQRSINAIRGTQKKEAPWACNARSLRRHHVEQLPQNDLFGSIGGMKITRLPSRVRSLDSRIGVHAQHVSRQDGNRQEQRKQYDRERNAIRASRTWYGSGRWKALRLRQLQVQPLCSMCEKKGLLTAATVCDHITPHRDDEDLFWRGPFQSLCKMCHDSAKQVEEARQ